MEVKITIETWSAEWRFEIEEKDFGDILNSGYYPTYKQCVDECNRYLSQLIATEQSVRPTPLTLFGMRVEIANWLKSGQWFIRQSRRR